MENKTFSRNKRNLTLPSSKTIGRYIWKPLVLLSPDSAWRNNSTPAVCTDSGREVTRGLVNIASQGQALPGILLKLAYFPLNWSFICFILICFNHPEMHLVLLNQKTGWHPATIRAMGSERWLMRVELDSIMGKRADRKPPGACSWMGLPSVSGYVTILYLPDKSAFVKYNYRSMICLLYKRRNWVLSPLHWRESTSMCKHGAGQS